jgi:hypothetical protein
MTTKQNETVHVPARRAGQILPGTLEVGAASLEFLSERTPHGGSHSRSVVARWTKGAAQGDALIELRPLTKTTSEITVQLSRPKGTAGWMWFKPALARLGALFAQGLKYEIETRNIEEGDAFDVRRTTPELVRARTA